MDANAEFEVTKQLENGERPLWASAPQQGVLLRASDAFMVPFSLLWCGFAIFWEVSVIAMGAPRFFAVFGAFFVLIGIYFVIGRFFVDSLLRARTLSDGSGTVFFGRPSPFARWNSGLPWPGMGQYQTPSFELIENAKRVHDQILEAQRAAA